LKIRALAVLVVAGCAAVLAACALGKTTRQKVTGYAPTGTLTFTWQAEAALGCATEGLCGTVGSLSMNFANYSTGSSGRNPPIDLQDDDAVARSVQTTPSGQTQEACADPESVDLNVVVRRAAAGHLEAVVASGSPLLPSAGTCAGPTEQDLEPLTIPVRSLGRRGYELTGADSFVAGPFEVTVTSHVDAATASFGAIGTSRPVPPRPAPAAKRRHELEEDATVVYRVQSASGSLGASFAGIAGTACQSYGTCDDQGAVNLTFSPTGQELSFTGTRIVKRRVGAAAALRDLKDGRLTVSDDSFGLRPPASVTGTLMAPGGLACQDTQTGDFTWFQSSVTRGLDVISLDPGPSPFVGDPLRTRCPGPTGLDIARSGAIAHASIAVGQLGSQTLSATFSAAGSFAGDGYAGQREGSIVVTLARVSQTGGTRKLTIYAR